MWEPDVQSLVCGTLCLPGTGVFLWAPQELLSPIPASRVQAGDSPVLSTFGLFPGWLYI